jgi:tetratricopeptide (TPR) repeat protein
MRARQAFAAVSFAFFPALLAAAIVPGLPVLAMAMSPAQAFAGDARPVALQATPPKKGPAGDGGVEKKYDPLNQTALSQFMETCLQGNARYTSRDLPGAIELYRRAITLAPKNALAHYLLGEALLASGSPAEAEVAWKTAEEDTDDRNPGLRGRVLFVLADLKERQKKWDDAKASWQVYADFASKHADAGTSAQTAISRTQAIDDMVRQDKLYEIVRQRIAAERDGGAEPGVSDGGAAKKK